MQLTINLATRGRADLLIETVEQMLHKIRHPDTILMVSADDDDESTLTALESFSKYPHVFASINPREDSLGAKYNRMLVEHPADVYAAAVDYWTIHTPGFDERIIEASGTYPDGICAIYSRLANRNFPAMLAATSRMVELAGGFFPEDYPFWFIDQHFVDIADMTGRVAYAEVAIDTTRRPGTQGVRDVRFWCDFFSAAAPLRETIAQRVIDAMDSPTWHKEALIRNFPIVRQRSQIVTALQAQANANIPEVPDDQRYRRLRRRANNVLTESGIPAIFDPVVPPRPIVRTGNTLVPKGSCAIHRSGGIGDNLICTTVLPALKKKYAFLEVITQGPASVVWENNPCIDKLTVRKTGIPGNNAAEAREWFKDRAQEYDAFWDLSQSCEWAHAQFQPMSSFRWSAKYRRKHYGGSYLETVHDICDVPYEPIGSRFYPTEEEDTRAKETRTEQLGSGPLVGWVCCGSRIDKRHPRDGLIVAQLIRELGVTVALFSGNGPRDIAVGNGIEAEVKKLLAGDLTRLKICRSKSAEEDNWPIRRGLTQLRHCDLVITVDTGPYWAVMAESVPKILMASHASIENLATHAVNTVALAANPEHVPCYPCHLLHDTNDTCTPNAEGDGAACLSDISVNQIVQAASEILASRSIPAVWAAAAQ